MGLGQKIKDVLHHDQPSKTYENDRPPGAFPSETTDAKHNKMTDGRDYATGSTTTGTTGTTGTGLTGKNTTDTGRHSPTNVTGTGNTHGGATGDIAGTDRTGHRATDSGVDVGHGHGHRKDHLDDANRTGGRRTADDPYWGSMGRESHGVTGARDSNTVTGYDDPSGVHGPHGSRAANVADPRVDSDRDHRGAPGSGLTGTHGANKDLPLRPNEQYGAYDSGINRSGGPGEAVGGGTYNQTASTHHDPASSVERSVEGREFTHTGRGGNLGTGAGNQTHGLHNAGNNPSLSGANVNDPYDTRIRDRDMGRDRTGHGHAGAGVGAGAVMAATDAARRHHHDDMHDSGYSASNTNNSPVHTRGGVDDHSRSGLTGHEPGVPRTSMLDPYSESPNTHGVGPDKGSVGGRNGSPPSGLASYGMGPDHYGPGHEGAKVMHTCSHCGRDNDISRYFKKDVVYRMN